MASGNEEGRGHPLLRCDIAGKGAEREFDVNGGSKKITGDFGPGSLSIFILY